jgi:hypothetical protein
MCASRRGPPSRSIRTWEIYVGSVTASLIPGGADLASSGQEPAAATTDELGHLGDCMGSFAFPAPSARVEYVRARLAELHPDCATVVAAQEFGSEVVASEGVGSLPRSSRTKVSRGTRAFGWRLTASSAL